MSENAPGEDLVVTGQSCRRIAVKWGADLSRDIGHADAFGVKNAFTVLKMVHGRGS
jgi:hypothetical protein